MDDVLVLHIDDKLHGGPCLKRNGSRELQALQQSTLALGACKRQAEGRGGRSGLDETERSAEQRGSLRARQTANCRINSLSLSYWHVYSLLLYS